MPELYDVLEVSPTATPEEIKRSYFRLVRRFPPEREPERFKVIRSAYETLSDPKLRQEYDTMESYGSEITELLENAQDQMNDRDWDGAIVSLKRLIVIAPQQTIAWNMLGLCMTSLERFGEAEKAFNRIISLDPNSSVAHVNLGFLWTYRYNETTDISEETRFLHSALGQFLEAFRLSPLNAEYGLFIARTYSKLGQHQTAWEWTERAIQVNGQEDFQDIDALFFLVNLCFALERKELVSNIVRRIKNVLPDDDARKYAAYRFTKILSEAVDAEAYEIAGIVADGVLAMGADIPELNERCNTIITLGKIHAEISELINDNMVIQPIKRCALFFHLKDIGKEAPNADSLLREAVSEFDLYEHSAILNSMRYLRQTYRAVFNSNKDFYEHIEGIVKSARDTPVSPSRSSYPQSSSPQSSSGGGCFVATAVFNDPNHPVVASLQLFRDNWLLTWRWGRSFVHWYYRHGPALAVVVRQIPMLRTPLMVTLTAISDLLRVLFSRK